MADGPDEQREEERDAPAQCRGEGPKHCGEEDGGDGEAEDRDEGEEKEEFAEASEVPEHGNKKSREAKIVYRHGSADGRVVNESRSCGTANDPGLIEVMGKDAFRTQCSDWAQCEWRHEL